MKKVKLFIIGIFLLFLINFISASEENAFNGGDGQYLISQTPGDIQNSPFRSIEENNLKGFGITGQSTLKIEPISLCWIIPLFLAILITTLLIVKRKSKEIGEKNED